MRLLDGFNGYKDENIINMDESVVLCSSLGPKWENQELTGQQVKNAKERITVVSYISRSGNVPFSPLLLVRHFPIEHGDNNMNDWQVGNECGRYMPKYRIARNQNAWMTKNVFENEMEFINLICTL